VILLCVGVLVGATVGVFAMALIVATQRPPTPVVGETRCPLCGGLHASGQPDERGPERSTSMFPAERTRFSWSSR